MKKTVSLLAVLVAAFGLAASASAAGPEHVTVTITVPTPDPTQPNFSCVPYGYAWDVLSTFSVTRTSTLYFDDSGNLAKEIRHVDFTGTLYRSDDLSVTIPYAGTWNRTLDVAANTVTSRPKTCSGRSSVMPRRIATARDGWFSRAIIAVITLSPMVAKPQ